MKPIEYGWKDGKITQSGLKRILKYNPETGQFTWRVAISNRVKVGDATGVEKSNGYINIRLDRKDWLAHRLAWLYMTGSFPKNDTDHINRVKTDNRFCNLREATRSQNKMNMKACCNNKIGVKGIYRRKSYSKNRKYRKGFITTTMLNGKTIYIGSYATLKEASKAHEDYTKKNHKEFYCS